MTSVLQRRIMDGEKFNCEDIPLHGLVGLDPSDIAEFVEGEVDDACIEELLFGLTWLNWSSDSDALRGAVQELNGRWRMPVSSRPIPRTWALIKLLFLPSDLITGDKRYHIRGEPAIIPLLSMGRVKEACQMAQRRLYSKWAERDQGGFS